jgi:putative SOS response-associated peptidase YedK
VCSHYQAVRDTERLKRYFGIADLPEGARWDVWPGYLAPFVRRHRYADVGDEAVPSREVLAGSFGLIPHWAKDDKIARRTYNARSETVASKPSFRDAWKKNQHCIIPAEAIFEPDWRSGKAVATSIFRADGKPMGIAGLWSCWRSPQGAEQHSFTMITINADGHSLMKQFHKAQDEKRMVVILPEERYGDWLVATVGHQADFLRAYPAKDLLAEPKVSSVKP